MPDPLPDHGEFTVRATLNEDLKFIREATERAKQNTVKPGHYGLRVVVRAKGPDGPVELIRMYHVDLTAGIVEIVETIQGQETARRTRKLDDLG